MDDAEAYEDLPSMAPPPLCHQHAVSYRASSSDEFDDSPPVYRSLSTYPYASRDSSFEEGPAVCRSLGAGPSSSMEDDYAMEAEPCYRSMHAPDLWSAPVSTLGSLPSECEAAAVAQAQQRVPALLL